MKLFIFISMLLVGIQSVSANSEIPSGSVLCSITQKQQGATYATLFLKTTFETIREEVASDGGGFGIPTFKRNRDAVVQRMIESARKLKDAGVCAAIINQGEIVE